ncbi:FkbM family methyltransferase [Actinokineospora guangxiensis]|uniref:FkbM family methyltransferase n=1 Tax=Actinokineospora guangxiensis TaxID=1490288 RepID=A0ABW0EN51_9PSEU
MPDLSPPVIACTVAAAVDLPAARVAARTWLDHHPGGQFVLLLVDAEEPGALRPADIGVTDLAVLATGHTAREAAAALRPRLIEWLLARHDKPVLHLDPHVRVYAPLAEHLVAELADAALLLVPRVLRPLPDDGLRPSPAELRSAGVYDAGFVLAAPGAEHFLHAWADAAAADPARAAEVLDGAPALVDHRVLRDPGLGLSCWNAAQRPLAMTAEQTMTAAGAPLRTVDFTGFDPVRPWLFNAAIADHPRVLLSEFPLLSRLCAAYAADIDVPGTKPTARFGLLPDGTEVPAGLRARFRAARRGPTDDRPPPMTDPAGFIGWACGPDPDLPGATRWAAAVWAEDPDLRVRFPDPQASAFREWCASDGLLSGRLPQSAVPGQPGEVALLDQIGVTVLGDGRLADKVRRAAEASGLPVADDCRYPVVLLCDAVVVAPPHRHVIAVRDQLAPVPDGASERWLAWPAQATPTDGVTTHTVPLPISDPGAREDADSARAALDLGDGPVFVAIADRCEEVITTFAEAFPDRADARLVLLVPGRVARSEAAERLRLTSAGDPRVRLITDQSRFPTAVDAASWAVSFHPSDHPDAGPVHQWLIATSLRGVPVITATGGLAAELLGGDGCVALPADMTAKRRGRAVADLAEDIAKADKVGAAARTQLSEALSPSVTGAAVRRRIELAYRGWRAGRALAAATEEDPLRPLLAARHALLRKPDVDVGHRIPMAPALRRGVLRVLNHYDAHLTWVMSSLLDSMERTAAGLVERQDRITAAGAGLDADLLRADIDLVAERNAQLGRQIAATGEEVARLRGEVADGVRTVGDFAALVRKNPSRPSDPGVGEQVRAMSEALETSQARIAALEERLSRELSDRDARLDLGRWSADQALKATDALRRVVVRQHERVESADVAEVPSSLVLCDAGLIRLPAQDSVMSAVLSSNGVWEPEVTDLVDSLIEPDTVFLDVGSYVGYHSLRVLARLATSGTVVAVEPDAEAVKLLRHNVSANVSPAIADRLAVLEKAAWDGPAALVGRAAPGGGLRVAPQDPESVTTATSGELRFEGVRLDKELDTVGAAAGQRLSVVKVDVPGRGHRVLGGLVRRLRKDRPSVIVAVDGPLTSGFGEDVGVILREFRTWGYELVRLGDERSATPEELLDEVLSGVVRTLWLRPVAAR